MRKVFVVGNATEYSHFINNHQLTDNLEEADIVLFTGGEDVTPSMYGDKPHLTTMSNLKRDKEEKAIFDKVKPNQLCIGVCRGSQFLCVMNGGKLFQDMCGHAIWGTHPVYNNKGESFEITSTHHQMQMPYLLNKEDYDVLYFAHNTAFGIGHMGVKNYIDIMYEMFNGNEPEIVLYHKKNMPKCLAIQGHPEYMNTDSDAVKAINKIINEIID